MAWLTTLVTYFASRRLGMGRGLALGAAAVLALASPWLVYVKSFYSEPAIGLALALALWASESHHPRLTGLAAGAAAILKPPFALVGIGLIIERLWARRWRDAISMSAVLVTCGIALCGFNYWLARTPVISGNNGLVPQLSLAPFYDTLLGPSYGLFRFAPWTIIAFISLTVSLWGQSSVLRQMAVPTVLYLVLLSLDSHGPGTCYGPRYWVPFLPWLAIASIEGIRSIRYPWPIRYALLVSYLPLAILSAALAIPAALQYRQLFDHSPTDAWQNLSPQIAKNNESGFREQYLLGNGALSTGAVTLTSLNLDIDSSSPNVVVINRKYNKHWKLTQGEGVVASSDGMVAVMVPAGRQHLVLSYQGNRLQLGLGVIVYLVLATLVVWLWVPRRKLEDRPAVESEPGMDAVLAGP